MIHTSALPLRWASRRWASGMLLLAGLLLPHVSGCAVIAQIAGSIPNVKDAKYKKLAGETVGVVVWVDEGLRGTWPRFNLDLAQLIQSGLQKHQKEDKADEMKLTRFPHSVTSLAKYHEDHPELAGLSMEEIAPKLGVTRLIYVEVRQFQTRPDAANELFRGSMSGSVQVIEVVNGKGHVAFTDDDVVVYYPKASPEEGLPLPGNGDFKVYTGALAGFAEEVAKRFLPHADDPDAEYGTNAPVGVGIGSGH